jgi:hypothetical protein
MRARTAASLALACAESVAEPGSGAAQGPAQ